MKDFIDELYNPRPLKLHQLKLSLFGKTFSVKFCIGHWADWFFPIGLFVLPMGLVVYGWANFGFYEGIILPICKVLTYFIILALICFSVELLYWVITVILRVARRRLHLSGYTRITRNWTIIIKTLFYVLFMLFLWFISEKAREADERGHYEPSYDKVGW
jgi:hypothetical protein